MSALLESLVRELIISESLNTAFVLHNSLLHNIFCVCDNYLGFISHLIAQSIVLDFAL